MKVRQGFVIRDVGGEKYAVATGEAAKHFRGMLKLNEVGAAMFGLFNEETTAEEVAKKMTEEYDVEYDVVKKDVDEFVAKLKEADILE